ncbi:FMRFamide receptor-like [Mercenaria mercenaria]|uniref:FMRFamide receptor-like n=1 Tax=Mercenaria mercenaria TaxID=6596 RepID=UPI00234EC189|nr:FMRFamide receptor-like [Mercenaria mercenaria]
MIAYTTDEVSTVPFDINYTYDYGDEYMYPGYSFERPVYLYLWEILVLITFFQNLLILLVFLHRTMRSPTNLILSAIAISDSLTGLVTIPTYIMVFQRYDPLPEFYYDNNIVNQSQEIFNQQNRNTIFNLYQNYYNQSAEDTDYLDTYFSVTQSSEMSSNATASCNKILSSTAYLSPTLPPVDGYILSKSLCQGFMISKYFLSKSFHTISIFLTLFLEIQRYLSVAHPYRYRTCFNKFRIVKIYCISAFVLCPFLHVYHLGSERAVGGLCHWELTEAGCGLDCIYLWTAFIVRHFIPCVTLVIFTLLFINKLMKGEENFRRLDGYSSQYSKRVNDNRRISFVVTSVVIVRLVPEIPYIILLLYNSIDVTVNMGRDIELENNRMFHMCYEICLVLSFLTNFYIYLIVNKSFRRRLYRTFIEPVLRHMRDALSFTRSRVYLLLGKHRSVKPGKK